MFATPGTVIFGVKRIADTLMKVIHRYQVHFKPFYAPVKIDADKKIVYFKSVAPEDNNCVVNQGNVLGEKQQGDSFIEMPFDLLHLAPPQTAPRFVKESAPVVVDNILKLINGKAADNKSYQGYLYWQKMMKGEDV